MMTRSRLTGWWRWSWVKWRVGHCSCSFSMKKRDERTTGQTGMIRKACCFYYYYIFLDKYQERSLLHARGGVGMVVRGFSLI